MSKSNVRTIVSVGKRLLVSQLDSRLAALVTSVIENVCKTLWGPILGSWDYALRSHSPDRRWLMPKGANDTQSYRTGGLGRALKLTWIVL